LKQEAAERDKADAEERENERLRRLAELKRREEEDKAGKARTEQERIARKRKEEEEDKKRQEDQKIQCAEWEKRHAQEKEQRERVQETEKKREGEQKVKDAKDYFAPAIEAAQEGIQDYERRKRDLKNKKMAPHHLYVLLMKLDEIPKELEKAIQKFRGDLSLLFRARYDKKSDMDGLDSYEKQVAAIYDNACEELGRAYEKSFSEHYEKREAQARELKQDIEEAESNLILFGADRYCNLHGRMRSLEVCQQFIGKKAAAEKRLKELESKN
jgi:hypothetical protein